jgi:uncharacterized protein (TIGR02646 family)
MMAIDPGFEKIDPTPDMPAGAVAVQLLNYSWESRATPVAAFKAGLKGDLRISQLGRCCYCRRHLADPQVTHLEHFIEKSAFPEFRFEIPNLGLSCAVCNTQKLKVFIAFSQLLKQRVGAGKMNDPGVKVSQVLRSLAPVPNALPTLSDDYRWVHPHYDEYSVHICIERGWIFSWRSPKGRRTIKGLQLNALAQLETRALQERLDARRGVLSVMIGAAAELSYSQFTDVCKAVASTLRRAK